MPGKPHRWGKRPLEAFRRIDNSLAPQHQPREHHLLDRSPLQVCANPDRQMSTFERLSGQDVSFLFFETINTPMNVGGVSVFDGGTLLKADGAVDVERIKAHIASQLHKVPRYRHRLAYIPLENQPVWVDDERFDLEYHVRHVALPRPGNEQQLKHLTADILSRPLDRGRPLWESWIVEGVSNGCFALVT